MCGIFAIFGKCSEKEKIIMKAMSLSKRGPDSFKIISRKNGLYIFHRLAINDLSSKGEQPMTSGETVLLCNGEIYNYKELEKQYDLKCDSGSDCEVILRLYEKIGFPETIKVLYGVFSIILVDGDNVFISRDRIGVRPLFMALTHDNYVAVSSTMNPLDSDFHSVAPFPPGISICFKNTKPNPEIVCVNADKVSLSENRLTDIYTVIHNTLVDAVQKRLLTDRPIGCLLSGGLDSSIITAILCRLVGSEKIRTYSIGMKGSTDLAYARVVAGYLSTTHSEVVFTPEEGFNAIPEVIKAIGSYDITTVRASVGMWLISKYIKENSEDKVIFSGEGSDEIFGGYLYFHNAPSPKEAENECLNLVQKLHLYDVLRADRCISDNGLEPRVPFLDRKVVDTAFSLPAEYKVPVEGCEKYALRKAFTGYLPDAVLWRRKEGFSDGVSGTNKSWYSYIADMVEPLVSDKGDFPSKEARYYKEIYDSIFPNMKNYPIPYWMPKWSNVSDPSGRLISAFTQPEKKLD
jgi:asparagine synthase (glutamine-hydrolysing)